MRNTGKCIMVMELQRYTLEKVSCPVSPIQSNIHSPLDIISPSMAVFTKRPIWFRFLD